MDDFLNQVLLGNTIERYLIVLGGILLGILVVKALKRTVFRKIKRVFDKTQNNIDNYIFERFEQFLIPVIYFSIIYWGIHMLDLSILLHNIVELSFIVFLTYFRIRLISSILLLLLRSYVLKQENGQEKVKQIGGLMLIVNILIWTIGLVFLLDNLGYNITAIITGLGIGGIAIALAAQNILSDLFNYFVIFFDRPFEIGDYLVIDDKSGTVDYIGIKTTRVRSLTGEQLVFSNADLSDSRIHNYKKMQRRRIVFSVTIAYDTPLEKLREIPGLLKEIVSSDDRADFDRAHFKELSDYWLEFEVVYHVKSSDYNIFMDIQQEYNFQILERLSEMDVEIAYPSKAVYIQNNEDRKFKVDFTRPESGSGQMAVNQEV